MPNPAAVAYEAYRYYMHEHGKTEFYLLPWDQLSEEHQKAWWNVVAKLSALGCATNEANDAKAN